LKLATLFLMTAIGSATAAPEAPLVTQLRGQGFSCAALTRDGKKQDATICTVPSVKPPKGSARRSALSYPNPVGIIVPDSLTGPVRDVMLYVHGFQNVCSAATIRTPAGISEEFNIYAQVRDAGLPDAVTIIPLNYGNSDGSYTGYSTLYPHIGAFLKWSLAVTDAKGAAVHIAAHSAGVHVVSGLADASDFGAPVSDIVLLDGTYSRRKTIGAHLERWGRLIARYPEIRIRTVYGEKAGTRRLSEALHDAHPRNVTTYSEGTIAHCGLPNAYLRPLLQANPAPG
jgi:hypothetical protein